MKASRDRSWILKLVVSLAVLIALAFLLDFKTLGESLSAITPLSVIIVLAIIPFSIALRALRLWLLLRDSVSLWNCCRMTLVGETLNIVLPASTGDLAKAYYGVREHGKKEEIVTATLLDKASGLLGLLALGAVAALLHGYVLLGASFSVAVAIGFVFYFVPSAIPWNILMRLSQKVRKNSLDIIAVERAFSDKPNTKLIAFLISIVAWILSFIHFFFITKMFGLELEPLFLASVTPLINLSRLFPFAFAGLGVQEGVTASLFSFVGIPAAIAVAISLVLTICTTVIPGLAGLYFILKMKKKAM